MRYKESLLLPFFGAIIAVSPLAAQEKTMLKIGGALRFNYNYSDWETRKPETWRGVRFRRVPLECERFLQEIRFSRRLPLLSRLFGRRDAQGGLDRL